MTLVPFQRDEGFFYFQKFSVQERFKEEIKTMAGRQIYNPDGFKNIEADGKVTGFEFTFKAKY